MAKDPAFLFYYQDFLVGVEFLSDEEIGQYIKILCHLADKGRLTEAKILQICSSEQIPPMVREKLMLDGDGLFYNKRLAEEVEKRKRYAESRRKNAQGTGEKSQSNSKAYAVHMENEDENENEKTKQKNKKIKMSYADDVTLTEEEHLKLIDRYGQELTTRAIEKLSNFKGSSGKQYKSDYKAILSWVVDSVQNVQKNEMSIEDMRSHFGGA